VKFLKAFIKWLQCNRDSKFMKNYFKRIKLKKKQTLQLNPLIKNCFIGRVYKSNNTFGEFPLEVKLHNIKEKRGSEIKR